MEILSDSVFRGNVKLANSKLRIVGDKDSEGYGITIDSSEISFGRNTWLELGTKSLKLAGTPDGSPDPALFVSKVGVSEFLIDPSVLVFTSARTSTDYAYFEESHHALTDPSRVIVLRKDIQNLQNDLQKLQPPKQYVLKIDAVSNPIQADCTQFFVGSYIPKTSTAPLSFQMFKVDQTTYGCSFTPIFADVTLIPFDNGQNHMCVLVNKASGYEMNGNYEISITLPPTCSTGSEMNL